METGKLTAPLPAPDGDGTAVAEQTPQPALFRRATVYMWGLDRRGLDWLQAKGWNPGLMSKIMLMILKIAITTVFICLEVVMTLATVLLILMPMFLPVLLTAFGIAARNQPEPNNLPLSGGLRNGYAGYGYYSATGEIVEKL
ncbi:MAG: DUF3742 family protein [Pseudomonadales bacterium]|jgi:hypothetical protein|nr:DUF3742 family protein [Pseudomonadales bacterium]